MAVSWKSLINYPGKNINWSNLRADYASGNRASKVIGTIGSALNLPEMGFSERARAASTNDPGIQGENEDEGIQSLEEAIQAAYDAGVSDGSGGGGGGGGTVEEYTPRPVYLQYTNRVYDLNNASDREAFFVDKGRWYDDMLNRYSEEQGSLRDQNIAAAKRDRDRNLEVYGENLGTLGIREGDYLQDWQSAVLGIDERARLGDVRRQGRFQSLGPNAYQSAMGTSGAYAEKKRQEAQDLKSREKTRELANFESQRKDINRSIEDTNYYFDQYQRQQNDAVLRAINAYRDSLNTARSDERTDMLNADASYGAGQYDASKYAYTPYEIYNAKQDSVDEYMPFLDFTSQATPTANRLITQAKKMVTDKTAADPTAAYLGDYETKPETDPLRQYGVV